MEEGVGGWKERGEKGSRSFSDAALDEEKGSDGDGGGMLEVNSVLS